MNSFIASLATFVIVAYAAIVLAMFLAQRALMYHPAALAESPASVGVPEMRAVTIDTADGLSLVSWFAPPARAGAPVIAYFHGNGGHIAGRAFKARRFLDAGYGVLLLEWRGFGGNPGKPTERGLCADAGAGLDWLAAQGFAGERLVIYGESLGTGVAVPMAVERRPAALVLEAPFTSTADVAASIYPFLPVRALMLDRYDSAAIIDRLAGPVLIVHGERDGVVPFRYGKRLFELAPEPKRAVFLPNADHNDLYAWGAGEAVVAFLDGVRAVVQAQ